MALFTIRSAGIVTILLLGLLPSMVAQAQHNFKQQYEQFRFGLHSQFEHTDFKISKSQGEAMATFLADNHKKIVKFRLQQLQSFERASLENPDEYQSMDQGDLESLKSKIVWYDSGVLESKMQQEGLDWGVAKHIKAMLGLMSVDPIYKVNLLNNQIMTMVLMEHQQITASEMADIYGKIGLGGVYLSTTRLDAQNWSLIYNNYYLIFEYRINVETGMTELLDIRREAGCRSKQI